MPAPSAQSMRRARRKAKREERDAVVSSPSVRTKESVYAGIDDVMVPRWEPVCIRPDMPAVPGGRRSTLDMIAASFKNQH
jgi:hypothetical protein